MRPTRIQLATFALVGLTLGLASAAPKVLPKTSTAGSICTEGPPSKARCLSFDSIPAVVHRDPLKRRPAYERAYLDGPCGAKYREHCRAHVEKEFKDQFPHDLPNVKMLRAKGTRIPQDVKNDGKRIDYSGPKKATLLGTFPKLGATPVPGPSPAASTLKPRNLSTTSTSAAQQKRVTALGSNRTKHKLAKTVKLATKAQTSDNILARTGLTRPPHSGTISLPTNAHRNPSWDTNGEKVTSCEEYAYEMTYDWARFTDAVAACAGDQGCQLDVAFLPTTPGIANRTLKRKDGQPTKTQILGGTTGKIPKNDLHSFGRAFAFSGGPDGVVESADLDALAATLDKGESYYEIGCKGACGKNQFKDEWAFHKAMHDRHRTVSKAEFEELERRKARFRELISQWTAAVDAEQRAVKARIPKLAQQWVNPLDMVTADPFERLNLLKEYARHGTDAARQMQRHLGPAKVRTMPGAGIQSIPVRAPRQQQGFLDFGGGSDAADFDATVPAAGVLAAPAPRPAPRAPTTRAPSSSPTSRGPSRGPTSVGGSTTPLQTNPCDPRKFPSNSLAESLRRGPISCQIGELLREEWDRMKSKQVSCLDLTNDMCDWSPMMFEARFVDGLPYIEEQNAYEAYCLDWTNDNLGGGQPNLSAAEAYIENARTKIEEALKALAPHKKQETTSKQGIGFGSSFTDADHFGDKALFAAGYDYDLGWDIEPLKVQGTSVCDLSGGARGGFGVHGWFINNKFTVVHGLVSADYNRVNKPQAGDLIAQLHLFEGAIKFVDEKEEFKGAWEKPLLRKEIQIPMGYKPSFTTMAGPVPITGAVWGEFFLGADLKLKPVAQTGPNCNMDELKFGLNAAFVPLVGLNAKAQVGVGVSGLLSAGVRGMVNLVTVGVPVEANLLTKFENKENKLGFDVDVKLALSTLSGWLAVYVELLMLEEEFVLFRWNGLGPKELSLLGEPLGTELPLFVMGK